MDTMKPPTPTFDWPAFSAALDTIRESRGLHWKDVSEATGVSATTISRVSNGKPCDVDALAALRGWMNIPIDKFFAKGAS